MEALSHFLSSADLFSPAMLAILIGTGFIVGFINTIAGLASAISYALFMAMGMPITMANGTTRPGVLLQFLTSSLLFRKAGILPVKTAIKVAIPIAIGSFLGSELANLIPYRVFEWITACTLPFLACLLYIDTKSIGKNTNLQDTHKVGPFQFLLFVFVGCYGGFTHAGVGLLIIFASVFLFGMNLSHANALKQLAVVLYTPIALIIFMSHGQINWPVALIYAIGNVSGAVVASKFAIRGGSKFIRWCVTLCVIAMSVWLVLK